MTQATPLWLGPAPGQTAGPEVSGSDLRDFISDLYGEGIRNVAGGDCLVTASGTTLTIATGSGVITGDDVPATQGKYRVRCTVAETKPWVAPPATNSRIDMLVWQMRDAQVRGGTQHGSFFEIVSGAAAASPVAPNLPDTAIPLAQWTVAAGATSIGTITDLRQPVTAGSAMGTGAQPLSATQIAALTTAQKFPGRLVENTTTGKLQHVLVAGATPTDVGGASAFGRTVQSYTLTNTAYTTLAFFVGTGFSEVEFTLIGATNILMVFRALVTAVAGQAQLLVYTSTTSLYLANPGSSTDTATIGANAVTARNLRLDADGFVRFEVQLGNTSGAGTAFNYNINWRAR